MSSKSETVAGQNIVLLRRRIAYLGALTALLVSSVKFGGQLVGAQFWLLASITCFPLLVTLLIDTLPAWISKRRERHVLERGIHGKLKDPGYFRLKPYEEQDQARFARADQAHLRVEAWIRRAEAPLLFLTGRSGSGKSSLLAAAVLPALRAAEPPYLVVPARSFADPLRIPSYPTVTRPVVRKTGV